jgi:hypothetical protein
VNDAAGDSRDLERGFVSKTVKNQPRGAGGTRSSAELRSALAACLHRKRTSLLALGALFFAASATLIGLGGPLETTVDTRQMVCGFIALVIAYGIEVSREWAQRWVDRGQELAAARFRTAVKDALRPVAELIAEMPSQTPTNRKARVKEVARQVTGSMQLLLTDVAGLRAVVYELEDGGQRMKHISYSGRGEAPGGFERSGASEPDQAFEALEQRRPRLVHDIRNEKVEGRHRHGLDHGYLTYIAVPIVVGQYAFGMLTLDAPEPNSFTDTDLQLCQFVAELLGIAFALAQSSRVTSHVRSEPGVIVARRDAGQGAQKGQHGDDPCQEASASGGARLHQARDAGRDQQSRETAGSI